MNRKTLLIIAAILGVAIVFFSLASYRQIKTLEEQQQASLTPAFVIPDFTFTNEQGQSFGSRELKGKIWIANFIFSRCPGPCLRMTKEMAGVQKLTGPGSGVQLVSFTVDPDFDKPDVLKAYGLEHKADPALWTFLTGDRTKLHALVNDGFKLTVAEATPQQMPESGPFIHSTMFVVVGKDGKTLGYLDGSGDEFQEKMKKLLKRIGAI